MKQVLVYAPSNRFLQEASLRLRLLALVEPMKKRGYEWTVVVRPKSPWGRAALALRAREFDAVILQRKWLDPFEGRLLRRSGARVLMDIDDATMFHETKLGFIARYRLERRVRATMNVIDTVCAGNGYLADIFSQRRGARAAPPRVQVIPTVVDPGEYPVKVHAQTGALRLVWLGSASTLKYLEQAFEALALAARRVPGIALTVICDKPPEAGPVAMDFVRWSLENEKTALLRGDIGIAPTPRDRWTLGKCGFKIVQYLAAGLPVIASPVGVNSSLAEGAGLVAESPEQWCEAIVRLAGDAALRQELGQAGRRRVESEFSIERAAGMWAEALGQE